MLNIYKASAGSGKTTLLTNEYIKTLLGEKRGDAYRNILAVTFTNKATDEMKSRIVEKLYEAAQGKVVPGLTDLPDFSQERAHTLLRNILHDYSRFSVSTIDKFFQKVIRAFVHELGIKGNYSLQLDNDSFLEESVDDIMRLLREPEFEDITKWLVSSSLEMMETDAEYWNVSWAQDNLMSLGKEIFKETFVQNRQKLNNPQKIRECHDRLYAEKSRIEKLLKEKGGCLHNVLVRLPEDLRAVFSYYNNIAASVQKFKSGQKGSKGEKFELSSYVAKVASDEYVSKSAKKSKPEDAAALQRWGNENDIAGLAKDLLETVEKEISTYRTAVRALKYIHSLQVINRLDDYLKEKMKNSNTLLLSNSSDLIDGIIDGSDTPFIYEKTGTLINHYFLDEFQDTSAMQWSNFRPLIAESLSAGHYNLAVGDVKQSIYRFRNSNWKILGAQLENDFPTAIIHTLESNYRSGRNIVEFNNDFFASSAAWLQECFNNDFLKKQNLANTAIAEQLEEVLFKAYSDVRQKMPESRLECDSCLQFDFVCGEDAADTEKRCMKHTIDKILELKSMGYPYSSMGILFQRKNQAKDFTVMLLQTGIPVMSDEALLISSSCTVNILVALLRYINNPEDEINNFYLSQNCPHFEQKISALSNAATYPLFQMCEEAASAFGLYEMEGSEVYLQAFLDTVMDYVGRKGGDTDGFLKWWDEYASVNKSIAMPSGADAVSVMTIHKAKGLAFEILFMPLCDWDFYKSSSFGHNDILWAETSSPFDQLPFLPVDFSSKLADTAFAPDYCKEIMAEYMDNLNLLYVAFTRPKSVLYAAVPLFKSFDTDVIKRVSQLLWRFCSKDIQQRFTEEGETIFTWGKGKVSESIKDEDVSSNFCPAITEKIRFAGFCEFKTKAQKSYGQMLEKGTRLHTIMSYIHKSQDLPDVIKSLKEQGQLNGEQASEAEKELYPYVNNPKVSRWFDGSMRSMMERDIIMANGTATFRPDRILVGENETIVVDYKFGEILPVHKKQVGNYARLLSQAGFPNVSAYIYYLDGLQIVELSKDTY